MSGGPRFLDEDDASTNPSVLRTTDNMREGEPTPLPDLPRGPLLLDAMPDAPARLDLGWMPEAVSPPRVRIGTGFWVVTGLCILVAGWLSLSTLSFVLRLSEQGRGLGVLATLVVGGGLAVLAYACLLELRAYRSLGEVEQLRASLADLNTTLTAAKTLAQSWLAKIEAEIPDRPVVARMLQSATTLAELRGILRSRVADKLRERANSLGRRAALEGATLVAICPHPGWDGMIAGVRGLLVIRQVAATYGLRPGLTVTLALVRRVAWTAAGTTGVSLVSQGLADSVLTNMPVVKHVASALPGTGTVAVRLYRLAGVTAQTCCPVSD